LVNFYVTRSQWHSRSIVPACVKDGWFCLLLITDFWNSLDSRLQAFTIDATGDIVQSQSRIRDPSGGI
jgi:hypothetical protein